MHLNEIHNKVLTDKHLSDTFPTQNSLSNEKDLSPLFSKLALEYVVKEASIK
jgi:hypothetical protein